MGQSVVKNPKKLYSQLGGDPTLPSRVTNLENNEYKITYYEIISGASGSITLPTGATINAGEFGLSGNCVLSKIDGSNKPTFESPKTSGGTIVTASLNVSTGAWVASGTYTDSNVALIYSIKIKAIYYGNLTYANIIETVADGSAYIKNLTSDAQAQLDAKLAKASNLSDLSNPLTSRTNLGVIDMHITTGDQSTTSNAASNITDLVSPSLSANTRYKINGIIRMGCNNTGGVKLQITIPTSATMSVIGDGNTSSTGGRIFNNITTSATLITNVYAGLNNANSYVLISGEISIGANAGAIQFGFASGINTQISTIYQLGTQLTLTKIN